MTFPLPDLPRKVKVRRPAKVAPVVRGVVPVAVPVLKTVRRTEVKERRNLLRRRAKRSSTVRMSGTVVDPQAGNASPEALVKTFEALLAEADFTAFLKMLGIGRMAFSARRAMQPVFTALCIGVWRLALKRAVPDSCDEAYEAYLATLWPKMKDADAFMVLVRDVELHMPKSGEEDFTPTAGDMFVRAGKKPDQAALVGMALFLRRMYDYFFNHLM